MAGSSPDNLKNEAGPMIHRNTTGPEILDSFRNRRLDYWVTGYGTGGTLTGAGQVIKRARPDIKIICSEPAEASHLSGRNGTHIKFKVGLLTFSLFLLINL